MREVKIEEFAGVWRYETKEQHYRTDVRVKEDGTASAVTTFPDNKSIDDVISEGPLILEREGEEEYTFAIGNYQATLWSPPNEDDEFVLEFSSGRRSFKRIDKKTLLTP